MNILGLSIEDRLKLVEDIWDSIAAEQEAIPLTPGQKQELDRRLEAYALDGDPGKLAIERIERIRKRL